MEREDASGRPSERREQGTAETHCRSVPLATLSLLEWNGDCVVGREGAPLPGGPPASRGRAFIQAPLNDQVGASSEAPWACLVLPAVHGPPPTKPSARGQRSARPPHRTLSPRGLLFCLGSRMGGWGASRSHLCRPAARCLLILSSDQPSGTVACPGFAYLTSHGSRNPSTR